LDVTGGHLDLRLEGWDAVWALRRHLRVPVDHVTEARVVSPSDVPRAGLRLGGTSLPGRIMAGRFWRPASGWSFWMVRQADEVLVVELHDERYRRLVLEVDDPRSQATRIATAET
jgi:hypothetical protein